jgi:hypothetical protein
MKSIMLQRLVPGSSLWLYNFISTNIPRLYILSAPIYVCGKILTIDGWVLIDCDHLNRERDDRLVPTIKYQIFPSASFTLRFNRRTKGQKMRNIKSKIKHDINLLNLSLAARKSIEVEIKRRTSEKQANDSAHGLGTSFESKW